MDELKVHRSRFSPATLPPMPRPVVRRPSYALCAAVGVLALCWPLLASACNQDGPSGPSEGGLITAWTSSPTSAGGDWIGGTPAVDAGRVYVQEANNLVGLDAATGRRLWSRRIRVAPTPPPTTLRADGGRVFVSETDSIMAVDGATGATFWTVHPDSQTVAAPALDATTFYTGQRGIPIVYALDRQSGARRWAVNVGTGYTFAAHIRGVAVSGDTVYAAVERYLNLNGATSSGVLVTLDRVDGHELWRYETPSGHNFLSGSPLPHGTLVIVRDFGGGDLVAIDVRTHAEAWRRSVGGPMGVVAIGDVLYTAGVDHTARALDVATGAVKWSMDTGSSAIGVGACAGSFWVTALTVRRFNGATGAVTGESNAGGAGGFVSHLANDGARVYVSGTSGVTAFACN